MELLLLITTFIQACSVWGGRATLLPFLPTDEGIHVSDSITRRLGLDGTKPALPTASPHRRTRNVMSILSLLWPQVVGPIDNGVIKEESFDAVAKTPLENYLEQMRERSAMEVSGRQRVRDMLNGGMEPAHVGLQQLHLLHPDMSVYLPHHLPLTHPPLTFSLPHQIHHQVLFHPITPPKLPQENPGASIMPVDWPFDALFHEAFRPSSNKNISQSVSAENKHTETLKQELTDGSQKVLAPEAPAMDAKSSSQNVNYVQQPASYPSDYMNHMSPLITAPESFIIPTKWRTHGRREESLFDTFGHFIPGI